MGKRRKYVEIIEKPTPEEKKRFDLANEQNYENVIWDSILSYNFRAQLDIAKVLYSKFREEISIGKNLEDPILKNISLRIIQLYQEALDQLALVWMCVLNKPGKAVMFTYMESSNTDVRNFYKRCLEDQLSRSDIFRVSGLVLYNQIELQRDVDKKKYLDALDEYINTQKRSLRMFADSYTELKKGSKKADYSGFVKGTFSIKHGFKLLNISPLAKRIWNIKSSSNPTIFQEIKDIKVRGNKKAVPIIAIGSIFSDDVVNPSKLMKNVLRNMRVISNEIRSIASIQSRLDTDAYTSIKKVLSHAHVRISKNDPCYCSSGKKFKKCHGLNG